MKSNHPNPQELWDSFDQIPEEEFWIQYNELLTQLKATPLPKPEPVAIISHQETHLITSYSSPLEKNFIGFLFFLFLLMIAFIVSSKVLGIISSLGIFISVLSAIGQHYTFTLGKDTLQIGFQLFISHNFAWQDIKKVYIQPDKVLPSYKLIVQTHTGKTHSYKYLVSKPDHYSLFKALEQKIPGKCDGSAFRK